MRGNNKRPINDELCSVGEWEENARGAHLQTSCVYVLGGEENVRDISKCAIFSVNSCRLSTFS